MKTFDLVDTAARSFDNRDCYEHSFVRFAMPRLTPDQFEAYNEGRRSGVLAGIVLGALSAAIMALIFWLLLG